MTDQFQKGAGSGWRVGFANVSFIFVERAQSGPRFFLPVPCQTIIRE